MRPLDPLFRRRVRWRPIGREGLEDLDLRRRGDEIVARSVVIGERGGAAYGVSYTVICDLEWRTRSLDLASTDGRGLRVASDGAGQWRDGHGARLDAFEGCIDIDLAGSPFTNTLPIRRLDLSPSDGTATLDMLYVPFDSFEPARDGQRYRCLEAGRRFRYEAADRSFSADILVDADGLVLSYPPLFERADHGDAGHERFSNP